MNEGHFIHDRVRQQGETQEQSLEKRLSDLEYNVQTLKNTTVSTCEGDELQDRTTTLEESFAETDNILGEFGSRLKALEQLLGTVSVELGDLHDIVDVLAQGQIRDQL